MALVVFGPAARTEVIEASDWYAVHSAALAARFIADVDVAAGRIGESPLMFPFVFRDVRRARLRRFPYSLFFRIEAEAVHDRLLSRQSRAAAMATAQLIKSRAEIDPDPNCHDSFSLT